MSEWHIVNKVVLITNMCISRYFMWNIHITN